MTILIQKINEAVLLVEEKTGTVFTMVQPVTERKVENAKNKIAKFYNGAVTFKAC